MSEFKQHPRKGSVEARVATADDFLDPTISVSVPDRAAGFRGGYVARNPDNHDDRWFISAEFFAKNYGAAITPPENVDQAAARLGLTAPRVTLKDLDASIVHTEIVKHVAKSGQVLRWAVLTLRNGFAHAGEPSASVSPENDSRELGEKYAVENARRSLWPLLGYALREKLHGENDVRLTHDGHNSVRVPTANELHCMTEKERLALGFTYDLVYDDFRHTSGRLHADMVVHPTDPPHPTPDPAPPSPREPTE